MYEREVWQLMWDKCRDTASRDACFEALTEDGFDVQNDKVIRPEERKPE